MLGATNKPPYRHKRHARQRHRHSKTDAGLVQAPKAPRPGDTAFKHKHKHTPPSLHTPPCSPSLVRPLLDRLFCCWSVLPLIHYWGAAMLHCCKSYDHDLEAPGRGIQFSASTACLAVCGCSLMPLQLLLILLLMLLNLLLAHPRYRVSLLCPAVFR